MDAFLILQMITLCSVTASPYINPFQYNRNDHLPVTPFYGYNFLKHNPAMQYQDVPTINWLKDVNEITPEEVKMLKEKIARNGVVKIPNQKLSRKQQMDFSGRLGDVIIIPKSFRGNDYHPDYPNIVPISNFWRNGTWKGKLHSFGQYWHKDGNFFSFDKGYILSMLYADQYDEGIVGGETAFINGCSLRKNIPKDIEKDLKEETISLSVRDIPDFKKGSEEDLNMFPEVHHKVIFKHPDKEEECIFLRLKDDAIYQKDSITLSILRLWDLMQNPRNIMKQNWRNGDIIIWDNYGVFHRAMPFINNERKRILYRTQIRLDTGRN